MMSKLNKKEILDALKADYKAAETLRSDWDGKIAEWKRTSNGELYGNEDPNKSKIVSKDTKKQIAWLLPNLADPFLSTSDIIKCNPITFEDTDAARQNEVLLNAQFCRKFPRYNFVMKALQVLVTEGTLVVQTGWDYEDEEVEVETEVVVVDENGYEYIEVEEVVETVVKKNQPTAKVCRNEDIFIDPTCMDDMEQCQFVVYRYETDMSTLKKDGRYKNLDKIKYKDDEDYDFESEDETEFRFKDDPRKKLVVYEYWGNYDVNGDGIAEAIVCSWIGDTIIRLQSNPYPDKKPPFIIVPFNSVPFQMYGEALAANIEDNQKVKTAITRGIIDNMANSNNGQVGMRKQALDVANRKKFLSGKNFEFNGTPNDFWQGSYNQIPSSAFDMLALMNNEIESQTGTKSFSGGISGNALGSTATGARAAMDSTAIRRMSIVRNIAENLVKPLMRKWMAYNYEFLEEEEIVRYTEDEFVEIRRDDLEGRIDVDISVATAEDNGAKSQELSFLLQTLGNTMPFEMTQMVIAEIARLSKMPELEKKIREFKPEPNPEEEQAKQMEIQKLMLENRKLQSEIERNMARAGEDQADVAIKQQKARVEAAKADKLVSETDKLDLDFLMKNEGVDKMEKLAELERKHQQEMEKKEYDRLANLDSMIMQARVGGKNEQIGVKQ